MRVGSGSQSSGIKRSKLLHHNYMSSLQFRWVDFQSKNAATYLPWDLGQPNGMQIQECIEVYHKDDGRVKYNDESCDDKNLCFYCRLPSSIR